MRRLPLALALGAAALPLALPARAGAAAPC